MKKELSKEPSQRQLRVAEEIRHVLGRMLLDNNLFIEGLKSSYVMVTEVTISPDLSYASVFVRGIADTDTAEQVALLNEHKGAFRYQIGKKIRLRIVPDIIFKEDYAFEQARHIDALLNDPRVKADWEKPSREDTENDSEKTDK